jgi:hypothetical protein
MVRKSVFTFVIFGIIAFVIAFGLGSILTMTTGIPLIGGLLNGILTGIVLTVGLLSRRFFLGATIMWVAFALAATITTTLGPPGIYKVAIGLVAGLLWDLFYCWISKYKKWGLIVGGLLGSASIMLTMVLFLRAGFGKDAAIALERYESQFLMILVMNLVITLVGILLGIQLYNKRLKNLNQFKNLAN